jgi:hypothetical protein
VLESGSNNCSTRNGFDGLGGIMAFRSSLQIRNEAIIVEGPDACPPYRVKIDSSVDVTSTSRSF